MRVAAALLCALAIAGCGSDQQERAKQADPFTTLERDFEATPEPRRAAPRWERIATLTGSGAARRPLEVAGNAIQWRTRWTCDAGRLSLRVTPAEGPSEADGTCPGRATFIGHGAKLLAVDAGGGWRVVVEQEVETRLSEPPLAAMRDGSARVLAHGRFHRIERDSRGTATLYELPSGRLALRLEDFRTSASIDLFVWLSRAGAPHSTRAVLRAPHRVLAGLKSTYGDQNYLLPRGIDAGRARSVVIWCDPIRIAYAAAPLRDQR